MDYYIVNTDVGSLDFSPHDIWMEQGMAFTGGSISYGEYLGRLKPNDVCFMYVNQRGIMAVGWVLEEWDGKAYDSPIIYTGTNEYRIKVDWFLDLRSEPVDMSELRDIIGIIPPRTLQRVVDDANGETLLDRCCVQDSPSVPEIYELPDDGIFAEGKETARIHKRRERNKRAVETKKKKVLVEKGS